MLIDGKVLRLQLEAVRRTIANRDQCDDFLHAINNIVESCEWLLREHESHKEAFNCFLKANQDLGYMCRCCGQAVTKEGHACYGVYGC